MVSSDVFVKGVRGRQRLHTFSGEIDVADAEGGINAETFSGDIAVQLVQGASASIDFDTFSGDLDPKVPISYRPTGNRRFGPGGRFRGDIGSGGPEYRFKTFSGDVRIR